MHQHKCLACYYTIEKGEDESFIRMSHQLRYYHTNWQDCQKAFRRDTPTIPIDEELQDA